MAKNKSAKKPKQDKKMHQPYADYQQNASGSTRRADKTTTYTEGSDMF